MQDASEIQGDGVGKIPSSASSLTGSTSASGSMNGNIQNSNSGDASNGTSNSINKPCRFFGLGVCRNGAACRFSHDIDNIAAPSSVVKTLKSSSSSSSLVGSSGGVSLPPPPPLIVNIPPGLPVYSVDVECAATSTQHNGRSVLQVALVDEWTRPVFNVLIKQEPVLSYITPLTGITKEMVDAHGLPLADALAMLRAHLPPNAVLVGQNILKDVQWLQLAEGVDYHSLIDLAALFRVWDVNRNSYCGFGQDHCAKVWLGIEPRAQHNALTDAAISMSLFNRYRSVQWDTEALPKLQLATLQAPRTLSFSSTTPIVDGCCMGNRKLCTCGAPFLY